MNEKDFIQLREYLNRKSEIEHAYFKQVTKAYQDLIDGVMGISEDLLLDFVKESFERRKGE